MNSAIKRAAGLTSSGVVVVLITWFLVCPNPAAAQGSQGQDAVYKSNVKVGSSSFIDASMFAISTDTICSTIYKILNSVTYSAAVIDARGFPGNTGASMTCATGWTTPWNNGATYLNKPATILLPATSGATPTPIIISTPWVIPSNPGGGFLP